MTLLASFIGTGTLHAILNGLAFFAFVLWLSLGYWTYKDAKRRMEDPLYVGLSTLLALVIPFVGPFIYMLFRPPEYLEDVRELRGPARADLAGLPVLRDADRARVAGDTARPRDAAGTAYDQALSSVAVERSLILIKPDAVQRRLAGEILGRFEARGFEIREAKLVTASRELGEEHYAEHREKPFFGELVDFITSGPTWALVVEGEGAVATLRATIGATDPAQAAPGTIRGDLAVSMPDNLVHGSDSPESAEREIALWFG